MDNSLLEQALKYAERGLRVFPLSPFSKIPLKGTNGSKDATCDKDIIKQWWTNTPQANIGLVTDVFIVLDVDVHSEDKNGYESLEILENHFEKLPPTFQVTTANDGLHYYFKKPQGVELSQKTEFVKGLDLKAHPNNYVVAAPSPVIRDDKDKGRYTIKNNVPMADCPQWLIDFILRDEPTKPKNDFTGDLNSSKRFRSKTTELFEMLVKGAENGSRNDTIARVTGQLLRYAVNVRVAYDLVNYMNSNFNEPLDQKEVDKTFDSIARKEFSR